MKIILTLFLLLLPATAMAQVPVTFYWDASDSAASAPENNPVKYRLYVCKDSGYTDCVQNDTGTALEFRTTLTDGTYYILARAYWFGLTVDGTPTGELLESGNSNVLKAQVQIPPGNPKNFKVRIS